MGFRREPQTPVFEKKNEVSCVTPTHRPHFFPSFFLYLFLSYIPLLGAHVHDVINSQAGGDAWCDDVSAVPSTRVEVSGFNSQHVIRFYGSAGK